VTRVARIVLGRFYGSDWRLTALVVAIALGSGALAARSQTLGLGIAAVAAIGCLLMLGSRLTTVFLFLLTTLLFGYAFLDKGFAYIGVYPLFISELVLLLAVLHLVVTSTRLKLDWLHVVLIAFMAWGLARTIPYIDAYGINALRDATLWGYGLFALTLSTAITAKHFDRVRSLYNAAILPFLVWLPVAVLIGRQYADQIPNVLGSGVSALTLKYGDLGVHLGGIGAFLFSGLGRGLVMRRAILALAFTLWMVGIVVVGSANRGALLAGLAAFAAVVLVRPTWRALGSFAAAIVLAVGAVLALPDVTYASQRSLSAGQVIDNITSILFDTGAPELEGSKEWRSAWWNAILGYTIDGPYFWTGKGFGVNLADDDGFQVDTTGSLRSPHNAHLNILARTGVPGLALWVALQVAFAGSLLVSYFRARRWGASLWCQIDAWLLVYWLALILNATVDVFFEGPQGGIWYWSVFGLGLAAIRIQRSLFDDAKRTEESAAAVAQRVSPATA